MASCFHDHIKKKTIEDSLPLPLCFVHLYRRILELEEKMVKQMCDDIIKLKPDLVITEKGISGKTSCGVLSDYFTNEHLN